MRNSKTAKASLAALMAQTIFGFSFMFTKIALGYASPMTVIFNRYLTAFIGLTIVLFITKEKLNFKKSSIRMLILMAVFQPLLYFIFESYGIKMTTSAFSSVMISLIPVVSMICGIFVLKETPSPMQYIFSLLSILGVIIMALLGKADGTVTALGAFLLLGAVLSSVFYNILSRKISSEFSVFERTYAMTTTGLLSFFIIALAENIKTPEKLITYFTYTPYIWAVLYLGIISSVVAFLLLNYANTHLPVAKTTAFSNITTVVSVIAGAIFLNENITYISALAILLIITGVFGVQMLNVKTKNNRF